MQRAAAVPVQATRGYRAIALRQFAEPLTGLLMLAAAVSFAIDEELDAAVIAAIVVVNAVLGFAQEASADRAVRALRASAQPTATVRRSGRELVVPSGDVVTGDVVLLREGDRVVADAVLRESHGLEADESMLTGESVPVAKRAGEESAERVYAGTGITRGRGEAEAVAVGDATELAHIANLTEAAVSPPTPLQRRLGALSRQMVVLGIAVTVVLAATMLLRGSPFREAFLVGVSVAVAAVPEGLATTVTITLALAARAMARRHAIVRRLDAAETLGEITVICTDKTGTLTENQLEVAALSAGDGYAESDVLAAGLLASAPVSEAALAGAGAAGDPLEVAIGRAVRAAGLDEREIARELEFTGELPFDAERRLMTRVWTRGSRPCGYVKGAPEAVLAASTLAAGERQAVGRAADAWAASGLRVLAVARRELPDGVALEPEAIERALEVVGLIAFRDPLRPASRDAVRAAHAAGITVRMLTGDHAATALAIAGELGIPADRVAARVRPEDKLRTVERLQAAGEVVAVTGDGVNDAPALRKADIGIAMGASGTEAAREAADVILTDDDFSTIIAAVREGRVISDNVRKTTAFLLSANLGEIVLFAIAVGGGLGVPMTVIQVLLVNLLTDGVPALALARDPASAETMLPRPRDGGGLFSRRLWVALAAIGASVGLVALCAFLAGRSDSDEAARTMAFATVALAELVLVFSCRSERLPAWRLAANPALLLASGVSAAIVAVLVYLPAAQSLCGTTALGPGQAAVVAALAFVPGLLAEAAKRAVARGRTGERT